jgi:hypothetical protein
MFLNEPCGETLKNASDYQNEGEGRRRQSKHKKEIGDPRGMWVRGQKRDSPK